MELNLLYISHRPHPAFTSLPFSTISIGKPTNYTVDPDLEIWLRTAARKRRTARRQSARNAGSRTKYRHYSSYFMVRLFDRSSQNIIKLCRNFTFPNMEVLCVIYAPLIIEIEQHESKTGAAFDRFEIRIIAAVANQKRVEQPVQRKNLTERRDRFACDEKEVEIASAVVVLAAASKKRKRSIWQREYFSRRDLSTAVASELLLDNWLFVNFARMSKSDFELLVGMVGPKIRKADTEKRKAIPVSTRLAITLRFLATGDSYHSLMYLFRVHYSTISLIVREVLEALIEGLKDYIKVSIQTIAI
ncbi:unnamed protein product [Nesidiocoris tenuis]|uniref:Transposase Helix-turn-helix domain-containing protein n=1 Tax=Nesidiocoris tenuis TaxID=355587 RepID=A0A6H5HIB7_9HEMI|nr:unnamed protein product [Nesidiocoris tenuis]